MPLRDIPDHRRLVDLLSRSIGRGTLPPSLIFAGADAAREVAIAVAQALNCLAPVHSSQSTVDSCGTCAACVRIARSVHPDVLVVEPGDSGSIKIEQVRDVIDRAGYRPFEGRRRVVIIDQADTLVTPAQNALLKTLEEPPDSSVFILLTPRPDLLLATVRSRCIRLTFTVTGDAEIDPDARAVAQRALLNAASVRDSARRVEAAKELHPKQGDLPPVARDRLQGYLRAMASLLRDAEVVAAQSDVALANVDARPIVDRLAQTFGGDRGVQAFAAIDRAIDAVERNVSVKTVADWVMLQL